MLPMHNVIPMIDPFIQAVIDGNTEIVASGLERGRNPNQPDRFGWIPLHRAAANDRAEVANLLIAAGSSIEARGTDCWTPLHLAAVSGSASVVSLLVEAGANVNAQSEFGDTPLHLCVISRNVESAGALLTGGALLTVENKKGLSPLADAEARGRTALSELFSRWSLDHLE
jgi:ankyrin repeat protein